MNKPNKEEFTAPFDLERWLLGEPALCEEGNVTEFHSLQTSLLTGSWQFTGTFGSGINLNMYQEGTSTARKWKMRALFNLVVPKQVATAKPMKIPARLFPIDEEATGITIPRVYSIPEIDQFLSAPPLVSIDQAATDQKWFEAQMASFEAKRAARRLVRVVPPIGALAMMKIAGKAMDNL